MKCRKLIQICMLTLFTLLLFTSCGVYSKVPAINPDQQEWEGPLLDQADMEHVQIVVKPRDKTIVLRLDELDGDISTLLAYVSASPTLQKIQHTLTVDETGDYVLLIQKQPQE